jgi:RimJ/RimL family protein N-acetyltransferase
MAPVVVETERLILSELTTADAEFFFGLNADPAVLRFTGDEPFATVAEAHAFLAAYDNYRQHGYGRWAMRLKAGGAWVGWCGLGYRADVDEVDLGFRLLRRYWGQGYATEASRAALRLGFTRFGLMRIVGRAMRDNLASQRVLTKLGMRPVGEFVRDGSHWLRYELTAAEWRAGTDPTAP